METYELWSVCTAEKYLINLERALIFHNVDENNYLLRVVLLCRENVFDINTFVLIEEMKKKQFYFSLPIWLLIANLR